MQFQSAVQLYACFEDCISDAAAAHHQLNASLTQYIENDIATGAFMVVT